MLKYPPFASSDRLLKASESNPSIRRGERGYAIALLQSGLIDMGYPMPISTAKTGLPDGVYGRETFNAVKAFQSKKGLDDDGIVGRKTMGALDAVLCALPRVPKVPPKPVVKPQPIASDANYTIGHHDPTNTTDRGAGQWAQKPREIAYGMLVGVMLEWPFQQAFSRKVGPDAVEHLNHFLGNTGKDKSINVAKMVNDSPSTKVSYFSELNQAQTFVETLPPGKNFITSKRVEFASTALDPSKNWFMAVGGYQYWGSGIAEVLPGPEYQLQFAFKVFDRYNWDGNKAADIPIPGTDQTVTVTDQTMAEFHQQGWAREYNQHGSYVKVYRWKPGGKTPVPQPYLPPGLQ